MLRFKNSIFSGYQSIPHSFRSFLMTFAKFFANWVTPKKFKWSLLISMCRLVIFVLPTISVFNWRRWFVSWLTVNPAFPSSDFTVGVEIITLQSGTCSLTAFLKFINWSKISLEVNLLALFVLTRIIKCLRFLVYWLCRISSTSTPGKFRTFTTWIFLCNLSSKTPLIMKSPAITIVFLGYKSWLLLVIFWRTFFSSIKFFFFLLFYFLQLVL